MSNVASPLASTFINNQFEKSFPTSVVTKEGKNKKILTKQPSTSFHKRIETRKNSDLKALERLENAIQSLEIRILGPKGRLKLILYRSWLFRVLGSGNGAKQHFREELNSVIERMERSRCFLSSDDYLSFKVRLSVISKKIVAR